jgi:hypothetical protein
MQCSETQSLFTEFADNTLGREELHALTNHLIGCQTCALEWQEFQQLLSVVHKLEDQATPTDLLSGIHAKLAKRGVLGQAWTLIESLNFSLSIPAAASIFTIAMLAGFLFPTSPQTPSGTRVEQGEILTPSRAPVLPNAMFAVSHNGGNQGGDIAVFSRTALTPHLTPDNTPTRLLSPDIHVLIENIDHDNKIALCREMLRRDWQIHRINTSLFLVHLPQTELGDLHALLGSHHCALMPASAMDTQFGQDKQILTAAIHFKPL